MTSTFELDSAAARLRTRRTMAASTAVHTLLIAWLVLHPPVAPRFLPPITEISLLDASDLAEPGSVAAGMAAPRRAPARAAVDPRATPAAAAARSPDERFERRDPTAAVAPEPQVESAFADRLRARLASLEPEVRMAEIAVPPAGPSALWSSPAASGGLGSGGAAPVELRRGGSGGEPSGRGTGPPLALNRGPGGTGSTALTGLAAASLPAGPRGAGSPAAGEREATAQRTLAGASLSGPIVDRPIVSYARPVYPEWAKREGVEGSVTLHFIVLPSGEVKESVMVQKTAGFADFDESARTALSAWRFAPLAAGRTGEQWGTITFHFRLRETG